MDDEMNFKLEQLRDLESLTYFGNEATFQTSEFDTLSFRNAAGNSFDQVNFVFLISMGRRFSAPNFELNIQMKNSLKVLREWGSSFR